MILCIETATRSCSVALVHEGKTIALEENASDQSHAEKITLFIDSVMKKAGILYNDIDAVAVSMGPGSYTGLRIGVSTAKGLCYAIEKPLIAVDTLYGMACGLKETRDDNIDKDIVLYPMIDARRMEVYAAFFDSELNRMSQTQAVVIDSKSFEKMTQEHRVCLFGDGADKFASMFAENPKIEVVQGFRLSASYMAVPAEESLNKKDFADVAYFEPFYLKDFVPGNPTVKGLKVGPINSGLITS